MSSIKICGLFLTLLCISGSGYSNDNRPLSVTRMNQIIAERFQALDIPPTYSIGQQAEGGLVTWLDSSERSGIVSALQDRSLNVNSRFVFTNRRLYSFSESGMGGGYQNTAIILAVSGSAGIGPFYSASFANNHATTYDGQNVSPSLNLRTPQTCGDNCLGGWYIPNLGELKVMYKVLCDTPYALDSGQTNGVDIIYLTSTYSQTQNGYIKVVHIPANSSCDINNLVVSEIPQQTLNTDLNQRLRFARQFG